jgi:hypothetical protein
VHETRSVVETMRRELSRESAGPIVVSGMLAEQLARQLGAGADPGAVVVDGTGPTPSAQVLVRVLAGDPQEVDEALVREADRQGVPVVLVQLWPQADWTPPFVLTPFVVECRAGEGFPLVEIADRIVEAAEHAPSLASRIPVLQRSSSRSIVRQAVLRTAALAVASAGKAPTRPLIALEQVRMLARRRVAVRGSVVSEELPVIAGAAVATLSAGFAFRELARAVRTIVPEPVADAAVAGGGTWALAKLQDILVSLERTS